MNHTPQQCNIINCKEEASRFIIGYPFKLSTFYLCDNHNNQLEREDDGVIQILSMPGNITTHEVGIYSCHPDCIDCN